MDRRNQYDHTKFKENGQGIYAESKQSQYERKLGASENSAQRIRPTRETEAF
jgi:hypothetical protein